MEELGAVRRLVDGLVARVAKRVEDTAAHTYGTDRSAAELCERLVGMSSGEAKRAIAVAAGLDALPATDAALREGRLSSRQADLIVTAAAEDPTVEPDLLAAASRGVVALRDACVTVRARREDETTRAERQHAARSFRMWTAGDGMVEGHFTVTPEIGGAIKARIDHATRARFRAARRDGTPEHQDAYAADAFADAMLGDPRAVQSGGYTTHVVTAIIKHGRHITTVAHLGRHIPAELRTAMIVTGRECSIDGCSRRDYLELDHYEIDHAAGGPTARWNLTWLCSIHHTRTTQGWTLGPPDPTTGKRRLTPPAGQRAA